MIRLQSGNMDGSGLGGSCPDSQGNNNQGQGHNRGMSGPNTPLTPSSNANDSLPPRYPGHNNSSSGAGPQTPHTPNPTNPFTVPSPSPAGSNNQCQQQSSNQNNMAGPHTPLAPTEKARYPGPSPGQQQQQQGPRTPVSTSIDGSSGGMPRTPGSINMDMMGGGGGGGGGNRYPGSSPQMPGGPASVGAPGFNQNSGGPMMTGQGPASYPTGPGGPGMKMPSSPFPDLSSPRMGGGMGDMGNSSGNYPGAPSDMPLNPGGTPNNNMGPSPISSGPANNKMPTPFDPISSMAQMSQQLTSQVGPGPPMSSTPPPSMMMMGGPNGMMGPGGMMGGMGPGGMGGPGGQMMGQFNPSMHGMQGMPQQMGDPNSMMMGPGNGGPSGPGMVSWINCLNHYGIFFINLKFFPLVEYARRLWTWSWNGWSWWPNDGPRRSV